MANSTIKRSIASIRTYTIPSTTMNAVAFKDFDTGIKPLGFKWCVIGSTLGFFHLSNYWYNTNTNTIHITIANPTNMTLKTDSWASVKIIDLD